MWREFSRREGAGQDFGGENFDVFSCLLLPLVPTHTLGQFQRGLIVTNEFNNPGVQQVSPVKSAKVVSIEKEGKNLSLSRS